jgi:glutathione S-transferase
MALAHKGLTVETIPWRFSEKESIAHSGQERVPVIEDGGRVLADSWAIANYLEEAYPDRSSLFGGPAGHAMARFFNSWADIVQIPGIASFVAADVLHHLDPRDRDYFRQTREKRFGMSLDDFCASRETRVPSFRQSLEPLRRTL